MRGATPFFMALLFAATEYRAVVAQGEGGDAGGGDAGGAEETVGDPLTAGDFSMSFSYLDGVAEFPDDTNTQDEGQAAEPGGEPDIGQAFGLRR